MKYKLILVTFFSILMFTNCKKNNSPEPDVPGEITITYPTPLVIFINGSVLKVEGEMTDNNVLSLARVEIRNKTTNAILFQQSNTTGNVGYFFFQWNWTVTGITSTTQAIIKVFAKDKLSNEVSKEIEITLDV